MGAIHPTAIIEDGAQIGAGVHIGAYSHVGSAVVLADGVKLESHVSLTGRTTIGADTHIYPFATLGQPPQTIDRSEGEGRVEIGARCHIREHAIIQTGMGEGATTRIGDDCLLQGAAHVGHDCTLGNHIVIGHGTVLGGHVVIDDYAIIGGIAGVHQFCRIGCHAFLGGGTVLVFDAIPYGMLWGNRAELQGLNLVGLKRRDFSRDDIKTLRAAYAEIFDSDADTFQARIEAARAAYADCAPVQVMTEFMLADKSRGFGASRGRT